MRTQFFSLRIWSLFLASVLLFTACDNSDDDNPSTPDPSGKYSEGFFVVNEGNFSDGDGTIGFVDNSGTLVSNTIYEDENGFALGGIIQNMRIYEGKAYIMTNNVDKVTVVDPADFTEETFVEGMEDPFDFAAIGNKGYISVWGETPDFVNYPDGRIAVMDLETNEITNSIQIGARAAGVLAHQGKIYVALEGGVEVLVIDPTTDAITTRIVTPFGPSKFVVSNDNNVWVLCAGGALVQINSSSDAVVNTIEGLSVLGYNEKVAYNPDNNTIYWLSSGFDPVTFAPINTVVYALSADATEAPASPFLELDYNPYGIGFNGGELYVGSADFVSEQNPVYVYNTNGELLRTFTGGRGPNGFVFQ
ncbi:MAG: DUF5074 domain-containing protein [Bacteroidota bacterium]